MELLRLVPLVLLLSDFSSLTLTEVVKNFVSKSSESQCPKFFLQDPKTNRIRITPTVLEGGEYKQICQYWESQYRFATLYDTQRRIPVYSAYTFPRRKESLNVFLSGNDWKNEPQLENITDKPEMRKISEAEMDNFVHQAVNRDYTKSGYTRGHVFPRQYAANKDQISTFTFTNVAPQKEYNNKIWEAQVETPMKTEIETKCMATPKPAYIVTGVVPGNKWIPIKRKGKKEIETFDQGVNVPSYFWTAFCCINKKNNLISKAYLAEQNERDDKTYEISKMSVKRLNEHLTKFYKTKFSIFGDVCLT